MSIFSRLFKIGQAKANKVIDDMEKPEVMLDQAIRDKEKQLLEARNAIQSCIATERQTKAQFMQEQGNKLSWEKKAEAALKLGKEELAVKALNRASEHEVKATAYEKNWQVQRSSVDKLKLEIAKMGEQINEYKRNKDFIIAQSKSAQVKKGLYEARSKIGNSTSVDNLMLRMKNKAQRAGFEADAAEEMVELMDGKDSLDKEFAELSSSASNTAVADKLKIMKAKLLE